jgi:hypothetical protein
VSLSRNTPTTRSTPAGTYEASIPHRHLLPTLLDLLEGILIPNSPITPLIHEPGLVALELDYCRTPPDARGRE